MPTNVICANEIWPAHPVSGTRESIATAVTIASLARRMSVRARMAAEKNTTTANRTPSEAVSARLTLGTSGVMAGSPGGPRGAPREGRAGRGRG